MTVSTRRLVLLAALACFVRPAAAQEPDVKKLKNDAAEAFQSQDWEKAISAYKELTKVDPSNPQAWHHLGYSLHMIGKLEEALPVHKKASTFPEVAATATYNVACVYAVQKKNNEAMEWLEKAVDAGFSNAQHLADDTDMDELRDDPRFKKLVAKLGTAKPGVQRPYVSASPRGATRVAYFGGNSSAGQIAISYGRPVWKDQFSKTAEDPKFLNRRWRLGKDFWTTCDVSIPVQVGEKSVPEGYYYMTLEAKEDGKFILAFIDPADARRRNLDAFVAHQTTGGIEVPMNHTTADETTKDLTIALSTDPKDGMKGELKILFGPHVLTAPLKMGGESQ